MTRLSRVACWDMEEQKEQVSPLTPTPPIVRHHAARTSRSLKSRWRGLSTHSSSVWQDGAGGGDGKRFGGGQLHLARGAGAGAEWGGGGGGGGGGRQLALAKAAKKAAWSLAKRSTCGLKRASVTRATSVCSIMSDGSAAHLIRVRVRLRGEEDWGLGLASRARARRRTPSAACPWWARPRASTRTREAAGSTCRGRRGW